MESPTPLRRDNKEKRELEEGNSERGRERKKEKNVGSSFVATERRLRKRARELSDSVNPVARWPPKREVPNYARGSEAKEAKNMERNVVCSPTVS